jgi:hypothetical protein
MRFGQYLRVFCCFSLAVCISNAEAKTVGYQFGDAVSETLGTLWELVFINNDTMAISTSIINRNRSSHVFMISRTGGSACKTLTHTYEDDDLRATVCITAVRLGESSYVLDIKYSGKVIDGVPLPGGKTDIGRKMQWRSKLKFDADSAGCKIKVIEMTRQTSGPPSCRKL